jgi:hypothetical protein
MLLPLISNGSRVHRFAPTAGRQAETGTRPRARKVCLDYVEGKTVSTERDAVGLAWQSLLDRLWCLLQECYVVRSTVPWIWLIVRVPTQDGTHESLCSQVERRISVHTAVLSLFWHKLIKRKWVSEAWSASAARCGVQECLRIWS